MHPVHRAHLWKRTARPRHRHSRIARFIALALAFTSAGFSGSKKAPVPDLNWLRMKGACCQSIKFEG